MQAQFKEKTTVHFLHIGKTGGSNIKFALSGSGETPNTVIHLHGHATTLSDVPNGQKAFFFLRNPIQRYISSFYSRQRQGLPRYFYPWTIDEEIAFKLFETANDLAEALDSRSEPTRIAAHRAMDAIGHVKTSFYNWLISDEYLEKRWDDIIFIGFQERLAKDFDLLKNKLSLSNDIKLSEDDIISHKNPTGVNKELSSRAIANLNYWYNRDLLLYNRLYNNYRG